MIPFEPTEEAKQRTWAKLSQCGGDFLVFLKRIHVHTIEACVEVSVYEDMDEFEYFVLKTIEILEVADIQKVNDFLHIGRQIIRQITDKLVLNNLLTESKDGHFEITELGKTVFVTGRMIKLERRRCIFHFVDGSNEFIKICGHRNMFLVDLDNYEITADWRFDIECLHKCIAQSSDWKQQRQFPTNIHYLISPVHEDASPEEPEGPSPIVIDKAQVTNCALVVKFNDNEPCELFAYPISPKGHLLTINCLFSLTGTESIVKVFPFINETPDIELSKKAINTLGQRYKLGNVDGVEVISGRTAAVITTSNDNDINWAEFYWQNVLGNIFCEIRLVNSIRMSRLLIESKSDTQRIVNHLYELDKSYRVENNLKDIATYKAWLAERPHLSDEPVVGLSSLAWEFGKYKLAYNLAEMEDMQDA